MWRWLRLKRMPDCFHACSPLLSLGFRKLPELTSTFISHSPWRLVLLPTAPKGMQTLLEVVSHGGAFGGLEEGKRWLRVDDFHLW